MESVSLAVKQRHLTGRKANQLRQQGKIPAVLYGHSLKPIIVEVDYIPFTKVYEQAGESALVDLIIDSDKPVKVLIQEVQTDPISDRFIHIDFHQVRMDEKIHTEIELKFIGEAPAAKEYGGIIVTNLDTFEVECLPGNLVHEIEVDLSSLKQINDSIKVADVKVPSGITVLNESDTPIVLVQAPRSEEELKALEEKPVAPAIEAERVEGEGKAEAKASGEGETEKSEG